ncbi:hypothetical protein [Novipirellula aureliae]|nr:hypothetical protein [Novipirellula aureliae]
MKQFSTFFLLILSCFVGFASADWKDDIGFTRLQTELGASTPTGDGVGVSQVEAGSNTNYMPDTTSGQFTGKALVDATGTQGASSFSHATGVANVFFGNTASIAPDVSSIRSYQAIDWLNNQLGSTTGTEPVSHTFSDLAETIPLKVQNHSWVSRPPARDDYDSDAEYDEAVLNAISDSTFISERVDFLVNRDDLLVVGGTDNGSSSPLPYLLAPSYNSLIVGRTDGSHAAGTTSFYGSERYLPHIVASGGVTSTATPMVASTAAMLYEVADGSNADHVETMRAVLMAGATKEEFVTWDRTTTRPLDERYGVGEVNAYNSYQIIATDETDGSSTTPTLVGEYGYDFVETGDQSIDFDTNPMQYQFDVESGFEMDELSIFLSWNINVQNTAVNPGDLNTQVDFTPGTGDLANLDMKLFDASNMLIDESVSTLYNFEHLYLTDLVAGSYRLEVSGDQLVDYGLAWRYSISAIPEPNSFTALAVIGCGLSFPRRRHSSVRGRQTRRNP